MVHPNSGQVYDGLAALGRRRTAEAQGKGRGHAAGGGLGWAEGGGEGG